MSAFSKHLDKIAAELQPEELIMASLKGTLTDKPNSTSGTTSGALVLTNRRFVFSGGGWVSKGARSLPLQQVTSFDLQRGTTFAHLQVTTAGAFSRYLIVYKAAEEFAKAGNDMLMQIHTAAAPIAPAPSAADELTKLAQLHDQGMLTDAEFAAAKAKVLS